MIDFLLLSITFYFPNYVLCPGCYEIFKEKNKQH